MSAQRRRLVRFAVVTLAAYVAMRLLAGHLAAHDPIARALSGAFADVLATALPLGCLRVFLFFVAPCWGAYVAAQALLHRIG